MRIIFTCYAISAAALCFILTFALSLPSCISEESLDRIAHTLFHACYLLFGPLLLLLTTVFGLPNLPSLLYRCELYHIDTQHGINSMDVAIVIGCALFAGFVTIVYVMGKAVEGA
jgi:hypothetical protein